MRKEKKALVVLALITAFAAAGLFLPGPARAGELEPPAGPDDDASAMYTIEDIYHYLDTGVKGTKRTGGFVEPTSSPAPTGHTLDEVHAKIGERCITCEGTLSPEGRWCDMDADGDGTPDGTVKDMTTGLVWLKDASWGGLMPHSSLMNANDRASQLQNGVGGLTDGSTEGDWRLPTKNELQNLVNGTEAVRSGNMRAFTGVQSLEFYWSSTVLETETDAWCVSMSDGLVFIMHRRGWGYVWPVRGGN